MSQDVLYATANSNGDTHLESYDMKSGEKKITTIKSGIVTDMNCDKKNIYGWRDQVTESPGETPVRGQSDVIYTWTDEAPMLATHSLLPIVEGFTRAAGVSLSTADISH